MGGLVKGIFGGGGDDAAKASIEGSEIAAQGQREALEYLKETEAIPQQFREGALQALGGAFGLEGGTGSQQAIIDRAQESPLYQAILGGQQAGEESILRNAAATGGLRSGNVQSNLYDYNTQLQNKALLESFNQQMTGLQGLGQLPSNANAIASGMAGIGDTLAQGQIAAGQAQQAGQQQSFGNVMGLAGLGLGAAAMFSDRRLKEDITLVGEVDGHKWYTWNWNELGNMIGLEGYCQGVMADEAHAKVPEAVTFKNGFLFVDYSKIRSVH